MKQRQIRKYDASEIRIRAERRLGEMIKQQKETVGLNTGAMGTILDLHKSGSDWAISKDNEKYTRWHRADNKLGATHRKLDGRLIIFTKGFAKWQLANRKKYPKVIYRILE